MPDRVELVLSCEHASSRIPTALVPRFRGSAGRVATHEGFDLGAIDVARYLGSRFNVPVAATDVTRLVVDTNRSPHHPKVFGREVRHLPVEQRRHLLARYHTPHRRAVADRVRAAVQREHRVVHVAVHSFTPILDDVVRTAEIGLLYDPARPRERQLCRDWQTTLQARLPEFRIRRNYPYRGTADGLPTTLRREFGDAMYAGLELEVNQRLTMHPRRTWHPWLQALAEGLESCLDI